MNIHVLKSVTPFYLQELAKIHEALKNVFLVFPNYCLGRGLMDIAFNEYKNEYYFKTGLASRFIMNNEVSCVCNYQTVLTYRTFYRPV